MRYFLQHPLKIKVIISLENSWLNSWLLWIWYFEVPCTLVWGYMSKKYHFRRHSHTFSWILKVYFWSILVNVLHLAYLLNTYLSFALCILWSLLVPFRPILTHFDTTFSLRHLFSLCFEIQLRPMCFGVQKRRALDF